MRKLLIRLFAAMFTCAAACDAIPRDSAGALDQIRTSKTLRVGVADNPPWIIFESGGVAGIETDIVERIAGEFGASVHYVRGSETELIEKLHAREVDLAAFGLDTRTPHSKHAALTRPYLKTREPGGKRRSHVLAVSQGESRLLFEVDRIIIANRAEWERLHRRAQQ